MIMIFPKLIKHLVGYTDNTSYRMQKLCYSIEVMNGVFVTGPAKTGHVSTNYTLSHYRSQLSST